VDINNVIIRDSLTKRAVLDDDKKKRKERGGVTEQRHQPVFASLAGWCGGWAACPDC